MTINSATARFEGFGKEGRGHVRTRSGALDEPYGFASRFEGQPGTNPEEMIAAAHASCFTMAASFALARAGYREGSLETECEVTLEKDGEGFSVTKSALSLRAQIRGIGEKEFAVLVDDAKANCPISKLLRCEITLEKTLEN